MAAAIAVTMPMAMEMASCHSLFLRREQLRSHSHCSGWIVLRPSVCRCFTHEQMPPLSPSCEISHFLEHECGFSQLQISIIQRRSPKLWKMKSMHRCKEALAVLKDYNFTDLQVQKILLRSPPILRYRAQETLRPKLDYLESLGFADPTMRDLVMGEPRILGVKDLAQNVQKIQAVTGGAENWVKALKRRPGILLCRPESVDRKVELFRQIGLQDELIFHGLSCYPQILTRSENVLKMHLEFYINLGVSRDSRMFLQAMGRTIGLRASQIEERARHLRTLGLSDAEVKELLRKYPKVLATSLEKIEKVMDYLLNRAGLPPNVIVTYPIILNFSLQRRIRPRHAVFKFLSQNGTLFSTSLPGLPTFINLPEKIFMMKYVKGNPLEAKLVEVYIQAMNDTGSQNDASGRL